MLTKNKFNQKHFNQLQCNNSKNNLVCGTEGEMGPGANSDVIQSHKSY